MLKSQVPVYICGTVFTLVLFPATDWHEAKAMSPKKSHFHIAHKSIRTVSNSAKINMAPPPNKTEMKFVRNYIRRNDRCLINVRQRSDVPFTIIDSVFNRYGLPHELKYLAVIESELKPSALSPVGAKGPWQLMPGTARIFGLKINHQVDERMNYYKSTGVAARYLKDLYREFGDWLLVLAAYNGGPGPVCSAMHKSHSRDFWILQAYLPRESRQHVKKFIATDYFFKENAHNTTLVKANLPARGVEGLKISTKGVPETTDEKFERLMNQSAKSLQSSILLLEN